MTTNPKLKLRDQSSLMIVYPETLAGKQPEGDLDDTFCNVLMLRFYGKVSADEKVKFVRDAIKAVKDGVAQLGDSEEGFSNFEAFVEQAADSSVCEVANCSVLYGGEDRYTRSTAFQCISEDSKKPTFGTYDSNAGPFHQINLFAKNFDFAVLDVRPSGFGADRIAFHVSADLMIAGHKGYSEEGAGGIAEIAFDRELSETLEICIVEIGKELLAGKEKVRLEKDKVSFSSIGFDSEISKFVGMF